MVVEVGTSHQTLDSRQEEEKKKDFFEITVTPTLAAVDKLPLKRNDRSRCCLTFVACLVCLALLVPVAVMSVFAVEWTSSSSASDATQQKTPVTDQLEGVLPSKPDSVVYSLEASADLWGEFNDVIRSCMQTTTNNDVTYAFMPRPDQEEEKQDEEEEEALEQAMDEMSSVFGEVSTLSPLPRDDSDTSEIEIESSFVQLDDVYVEAGDLNDDQSDVDLSDVDVEPSDVEESDADQSDVDLSDVDVEPSDVDQSDVDLSDVDLSDNDLSDVDVEPNDDNVQLTTPAYSVNMEYNGDDNDVYGDDNDDDDNDADDAYAYDDVDAGDLMLPVDEVESSSVSTSLDSACMVREFGRLRALMIKIDAMMGEKFESEDV